MATQHRDVTRSGGGTQERILLWIDGHLKWILTLPALIVLFGLMIYPVIRAGIFSTYRFTGGGRRFVGPNNYVNILTDASFLSSLWITAKFTFVSVVVSMVLGFGIALLLNKNLKFRGGIQTLILIPMLVSPTVIGLVFNLLYLPEGVLNYVIVTLGGDPIQWTSDASIALWAIAVADIWQWTSLVVLVMLAGLQSVPDYVTEAAILDGASRYQRFRDITLPYLRQLIVLMLIIRTIGSMREFAKVFVMTRGGPGGSTNVVSIHLYHEAFRFGNYGRASTMAIILLVVSLVIAFLFVKIAKIEF